MTLPGYLFFSPFPDSGLWEFCNCLEGNIPQLHCGCESFSCGLETYIYCREGGLWASLNEAFWNHWFPGKWEKRGWRKLADCSAVCWMCKWPLFDHFIKKQFGHFVQLIFLLFQKIDYNNGIRRKRKWNSWRKDIIYHCIKMSSKKLWLIF